MRGGELVIPLWENQRGHRSEHLPPWRVSKKNQYRNIDDGTQVPCEQICHDPAEIFIHGVKNIVHLQIFFHPTPNKKWHHWCFQQKMLSHRQGPHQQRKRADGSTSDTNWEQVRDFQLLQSHKTQKIRLNPAKISLLQLKTWFYLLNVLLPLHVWVCLHFVCSLTQAADTSVNMRRALK